MKNLTLIILLFSLLNYFFNSSFEIRNYSEQISNVNLQDNSSSTYTPIIKKDKNQSHSSSNRTRFFLIESIEEELEEKNRKNSPNFNSFQSIQKILGFIYHSGNYVSEVIYHSLSNISTSFLIILFQIFRL